MSSNSQKYLEKLIQQVAEGIRSGKGGIIHTTVLHDDGCRLLRQEGECDCSPEMRFSEDGEEKDAPNE